MEEIDVELEKLAQILVEDNDKLESLHQLYNAKGGDALERSRKPCREEQH